MQFIDKNIGELNAKMDTNRENYFKDIEKAEQERKHAELNRHLREHIDDIFEKPLLHKLWHHIKPSTKEKDLHEAIIAASALIATARGDIDDIEIDFIRQQLGKVEIIKHIDINESIKHFKDFATMIKQQEDHMIKNKLVAISSEKPLCKVTMGFAIGMAKTHATITSDEKEALKNISEILKMPNDIDSLLSEIKL